MDKNSLTHAKWRRKYNAVFASKFIISEIMGYLKRKVH